MTRIVAGRWGGRRLKVPQASVRPTSERVREAVANRLEHLCGGLQGLTVLDLYAGSGAMGLELASRGAAAVTFVEADRNVSRILRSNIAALEFTAADVVTGSASGVHRRLGGGTGGLSRKVTASRFDIVFADPPYAVSLVEVQAILGDLLVQDLVHPQTWFVVESAKRTPGQPWPAEAEIDGYSRDYGDTRIWYGQVTARPSTRLGG